MEVPAGLTGEQLDAIQQRMPTGTRVFIRDDPMQNAEVVLAERRAVTGGNVRKLAGWVPVSRELLADAGAAPAVEQMLSESLWWHVTGLKRPTSTLLPGARWRARRHRWWHRWTR